MNKYLSIIFFSLLLFNCNLENKNELNKENQYNVIPIPTSLVPKEGRFIIDKNTAIIVDGNNEHVQNIATDFLQKIKIATGFSLSIKKIKSDKNTIVFQLDKNMADEGKYSLSVTPDQITIKAGQPIGLFYAVQTLRQLLPNEFENKLKPKKTTWSILAVEINDSPRFVYRGMHLDVSRHFFDINTIKKLIDQLAYHKMNYFHWHLTDDQGWRIEIKKYPELTEVGAYRNGTLVGHYNDQPHQFDGKKYGGFYTQEEIKEVVQYATERFVTIIPEIELPGHAQAALAAYPELGCEGDSFDVWQKWGVSENIFCPKEETFEFLENVLNEVIDLFPGKYIHIGGDECPKIRWEESAFCQQLMQKEELKDEHELQSYFIRRIEKHINSKGRQIIGWDEILEGGLAPNATVMSWRGVEGGVEAAKSGHDVIMTPTSHCYFDYYQSDHPDEPLAIGGLIPLEKIYNYKPIPDELNESETKYILGTQANLWSEYIPTPEKLEYMVFPRLSALAEVAWSQKNNRDFDGFIERLTTHLKRLELMGINAANHLYDLNTFIQPSNGKVEVRLNALAKNAAIYYTTDGSEPSLNSNQYTTSINVESNMQLKAQAFVESEKVGRGWQQSFNIHKAAGKMITLSANPHPKYSGNGVGSVINGVLGNDERYGDAEWLGFDGEDFEAVIDFGKTENINEIIFRFFKGEGQWIYLPKEIIIFSSPDGNDFMEIAKSENIKGENKVVEFNISLKNTSNQFLKIIAKNYGVIPKGKQGGGNKAWMFIDEIRVN